MNAAQAVLIVLVAALGLYALILRTRTMDRVLTLVLVALGVLLVAWPSLASDVASGVGIGRGTDLVFYLFIIFCLFRFVSMSSRMRRLERQLTEVVRDLAIRDARRPGEHVGADAHASLEHEQARSGTGSRTLGSDFGQAPEPYADAR